MAGRSRLTRLGPARLPGSIAVDSPVACSSPRPFGRPPPDIERANRVLRGASRFSRPLRGRLFRSRHIFRTKMDVGRLRRRTPTPPLAARRGRGQRRAVVLLAGPAGAGKSTLVVRLIDRGWRLFGDDVVPVDVNRQVPCLSRSPRMFGRHHRQIPATGERSSNSRSRWWRYRQTAWRGSRPNRRDCISGVDRDQTIDRRSRRFRSYRPLRRWPGALSSNLGHTWPRGRRVPACAEHRLLPSRLPGRDSCCRRVGATPKLCVRAEVYCKKITGRLP